jgi:hypothetical protein
MQEQYGDPAGIERLRLHLRRHNQRVLWLTVGALMFAAALWAVLYFVAWWLFILFGTAIKSTEFEPAAGPVVRGFIVTAVVLCAMAWVWRVLYPNEAPRDRRGLGEALLDLLLAVPRLTLAALHTGGAGFRLTDSELASAWELLQRMNASERPIFVQETPVDIPDEKSRHRILLALQVSEIIETRPTPAGPVLGFHNEAARRIAEDRVRLRT